MRRRWNQDRRRRREKEALAVVASIRREQKTQSREHDDAKLEASFVSRRRSGGRRPEAEAARRDLRPATCVGGHRRFQHMSKDTEKGAMSSKGLVFLAFLASEAKRTCKFGVVLLAQWVKSLAQIIAP
ncbi:hypothetical protein PIB30_070959, partial [Stylosanthes scabra]|nr:hypothetical protein [Stylosanthes scabra]